MSVMKMNQPIQPYRADKPTIKVEALSSSNMEKENQKPSAQLTATIIENQHTANNNGNG